MTATTRHFSPRASLAALGHRLDLLEAIASAVKVPQKTVRHTPAEKLYDAFIAILSGAHGLSELNTQARGDFPAGGRAPSSTARPCSPAPPTSTSTNSSPRSCAS